MWEKGKIPEEVRKQISETLKRKGIKPPLIKDLTKRDKHYNWKGGTRKTAKKIAIEDYKMNPNECQICTWLGDYSKKKRIVLHHHNGNPYDNRRQNLCFICDFCHNAIHDNKNKQDTRFKQDHQLNKHELKVNI